MSRKYWESASNKCPVAREGLKRISRIFELDASWQGLPPNEIKSRRQTLLKPHVTAFMEWAAGEFTKVEHQRGELRSALGYAVRNRAALMRFRDDGRLQMTNNHSERELRAQARQPVAVDGRVVVQVFLFGCRQGGEGGDALASVEVGRVWLLQVC